jgi:hypothetical protein
MVFYTCHGHIYETEKLGDEDKLGGGPNEYHKGIKRFRRLEHMCDRYFQIGCLFQFSAPVSCLPKPLF